MTKLIWDQVGTRLYETGLDHGVLYLPTGTGIPWNGLTSLDEKPDDGGTTPLYIDGLKVSDIPTKDDFSASLKALTFPDEFLPFDGTQTVGKGLYVDNQQPQRFGLSYRTQVGNDVDGLGYGYKIHLIYNLTAIADANDYTTTGKDVDAMEFSWDINSIPETITGYDATAHAIIDTRRMNKYLLADLLNILYGSATTTARLPSLDELTSLITYWVLISVKDNGDGTATITGPDEYVYAINSTTWRITNITLAALDASTVIISSTYP
jgi:hypothetical protein